MTTDDEVRFTAALMTLANVIGRELTPEVIEAWFIDLRPYPIDMVVEALNQYRATNRTGFFPVPGMIAELVNMNAFVGSPAAQLPEAAPTDEQARAFLAKLRRSREEMRAKVPEGRWGPRSVSPRTSDPEASGGHTAPDAESDKEGA